MEVREGMSSVVLALGPGHTLRQAAAKMTEKGTGAALVFDEESPAPRIITERDMLLAIGRGQDPDTEVVADHMSDSTISAPPDWSLEAPRRRWSGSASATWSSSTAASWSACSRCATSSAAGPRRARRRA